MTTSDTELKHNAVGFWRIVFQGVSSTAPAAIVASITAGSAYAGGSVPLSFVVAFIAVLFTIVAIHQYSKKVSHAGGYYAYVSRSAGPFLGIFTGMLLIGYQIADLAFLPLFFVILVEYSLQYLAGVVLPTYAWVILALVSIVAWSIPPYLGIKPSLSYSIVFGLAEVLVLGAAAVAIIVVSGPQNTFSVFTPVYSPTGINGVFLGGIFAVTSFLGYGSVTTLGEEAENPKKTIGRALLADTLIAGLFFIVFSYAYTIGWGPSNMSGFTNALIPGTIETRQVLGLLPALAITFFALESFFNSSLSFTNSAIRYLYGFSRDNHILPKSLSAVHDGSGSPRKALLAVVVSYTVLSLAMGAVFGLFTGFVLLATVATIFSLTVHIIVNSTVSLIYKGKEKNILVHIVLPAVASLMFLFIIFSTVYPISTPIVYAPLAALVWALVSVGLVFVVRTRKPEEYKNAGMYSTTD